MNQPVTIEELKNVIALRELPDEHLEWILAHSEYHEYQDGDVIMKTGETIEVMWMMLEGRANFYMNVNGRLVHYFSFENDEVTGGMGGLLPYSRMKTTPGTSVAVGKVRALMIHKKYFQELEQLNPDFIQRLIGYMTERARIFATMQMQHEKVSALGKLAAGIAHELNNPAAAINRISEELNKRLKLNFELTEELVKYNIKPELINNIRETITDKETKKFSKIKITPLERINKEDEMNEWFAKKNCSGRYEIAEILIETGFTIEDLEKIGSNLKDEELKTILNWLENLLNSEILLKDLDTASGHITNLVQAIKSHVHMDRTGGLYRTNIHKDIEDTLILLGYKIREKNIKVNKIFDENMPEIEASGDLNQVWTNIIDNAIYAMPQNGELSIETYCNERDVNVRITDNGSGIPKEIISRIFDPFFTTKKVGEGTGIGLDIVQNVVKKHHGEIKVNSKPGKTEFIVCLPVSQNVVKEEKKDETSIHSYN